MNTEFLIAGTGALATLFAARLAQAGYQITMLGTWREGLDALRKNGARLVDANGSEHSFTVQATNNPRECVGIKHALVLVKAWQTERVAQQLAECLPNDGVAVTLQNGLGNRETLAQSLGFDRVAMLLAGASSLRDVIAFPKTTAARALFEGAPTSVPADDLHDLHIAIVGD